MAAADRGRNVRQILIQVPAGHGRRVFDLAAEHDAMNSAIIAAEDHERRWDVVLLHLRNDLVDDLLSHLEDIPDLRVTLNTSGVLPLEAETVSPPVPAFDVTPRSPIEVFLNRVQSGGTWPAFLGYAAVAGAVVFVGLYEEVIYLLTAAMLVAPYAGPAVNTAIATASGEFGVLRRSLLRYVVSIATTAVVAGLLAVLAGQTLPTPLMVDVVSFSALTLLLPVGAGVGAGLFAVHSEDTSIVSGAAVGILVAAALAPPAGIAGMGLAIGRPDLAAQATFLLVGQLVGINLTAGVVFRLYGMSPRQPTFALGQPLVFPVSVALSVAIMAALFGLQLLLGPALQRDTIAHRALEVIEATLDEDGALELVDSDLRTARYTVDPERLVATIHVVPMEGQDHSDELRERTVAILTERLAEAELGLDVLLDVVVVAPPG
jgi:uncharacterized membrane protein